MFEETYSVNMVATYSNTIFI